MVRKLPYGIDTQLSRSLHQVADILHYQVNLARAFLKDSPILLIDELPYAFLNSKIGQNFIERILDWRGQKTIILVSHWSEHIKLADRSIGLLKSNHAIVSKPDEVLARLANDSIINEEYF